MVMVRTIGASLSPVFYGAFLANPALLGLPFLVSGGLEILYVLGLYHSFRGLKPPVEQGEKS